LGNAESVERMTTKRRLCGEGPHYVYYLYDAEGLLADIGRSVNPQGRKRAKEKMWGESFTMKVSKPIDAIEDACNKERSELRKYRPRLSRIAMSAKGTFGKKRSESAREAVSKKLKGVPFTAEHSEHLSGANNGMYGRRHTKAAREAMSIARKGVPFTPEHLKNLARANRSEERRLKLSAQKKGVPLSPKNLAGIRKALKSPEVRAKMSASHKGMKTAPEVTAKIAAANTGKKRTAQQCSKMSAAQKLRFAKEREEKELLSSGWGHPWRLASLDAQTHLLVE